TYGVRSGIAEGPQKGEDAAAWWGRLPGSSAPPPGTPSSEEEGVDPGRLGLSRGWDRLERRTEERIGGIAVVVQPQPVHPSDARTWVEEHVPEDSPADACRPTGLVDKCSHAMASGTLERCSLHG
uniref:SCAN box domain-containing protein n=1 Tax=Oryzias latipes TaxID=8090 RepID=A0A3P9K7C0_ORYLA